MSARFVALAAAAAAVAAPSAGSAVKPNPVGPASGSLIIAKQRPNPIDQMGSSVIVFRMPSGTAIIAKLHPNPFGTTTLRVHPAAR